MSWGAEQVALDDEPQFEILNGLWKGKKPPFANAGVIRNTNFTASGRIDYSNVAWLEVEEKQLAKRRLEPGDIILERSGGGPKQPVGRVVYFAGKDEPFSFSNFTSAIRVRHPETFDSKFVFYVLLELYQSGRTEDIQRRTTGIRNLDFSAYKARAAVPRIPIPEQRRVVQLLELAQRAVAHEEQLVGVSLELKRTVLRTLLSQGIRGEPVEETEIGVMPKAWEPTPLGTCCEIRSGSLAYADFMKIAASDDEAALESMAVKVSDMNLPGNEQRFVTANAARRLPEALVRRKLLPPRTVVLPKRGAAIATNKKRLTTAWTALDPNLIGLAAHEDLLPEFLFQWIQTFDLRTITDPGPTPQLNKKDLSPVLVPLPPTIDEQLEIVDSLTRIDLKIDLHQRKLAAFVALFGTMLHQLVTGAVRLPISSDVEVVAAARVSP